MPLHYKELDAWPTAVVHCEVCRDKIIYYVYTDKGQTMKRRKPKCHSGTCTEIHEKRKGKPL